MSVYARLVVGGGAGGMSEGRRAHQQCSTRNKQLLHGYLRSVDIATTAHGKPRSYANAGAVGKIGTAPNVSLATSDLSHPLRPASAA
jgi:hypothetical protein